MTDSSNPPSVIHDRYQLTAWLGGGGLGPAYRARDRTLDREVTVKFLQPQYFSGAEAINRFLHEARQVARLSHPNLLSVLEAGTAQGWQYLILEYIPGTDLRSLISSHSAPWALAEAMPVLKSTLEALAYAHSQGVVHGDIRPENILITSQRQVKVMDFGLAPVLDATRDLQGSIDVRTDLYSLGVVLYELLAGGPPLPGEQPIPLHDRRPDLPPFIDTLIQRLMSKEPDRRFASASEALSVLAEEMATQPGKSNSPAAIEQMEKPQADSQELQLYASTEDVIAALESERRRISSQLKQEVIEPLNLLLSQAGTYEKTLAGDPMAHMAVSVLSSLARQVLQQVRDLDENLQPSALESMGLEPALENLASQMRRTRGLQVTLELARLPERLPRRLELAFLRLCQNYFEAIQQIGASHVQLCLKRQDETLAFELSNNAHRVLSGGSLDSEREWLEQLGGTWSSESRKNQISIRFRLAGPADLTPREREVIRLVAEGLSNKQIAQALSISVRTVNFHLDHLFAKLGVRSRTEAAILAMRQGWIERSG